MLPTEELQVGRLFDTGKFLVMRSGGQEFPSFWQTISLFFGPAGYRNDILGRCLRLQRFEIYAQFDLLLYFALIIRYIAGSSRSFLFTDTVQNPGEGSLMSST